MADDDKTNILVVDDLPEKLIVYRSILDELGQNLIAAHSGAEALKEVLRHDFAVILLDVNMPGMDGLETASLIRTRKRSAHTPIIFVTSYLDDVRAVQGYMHGGVDYILAPVVPEILRAKVKVFVDLFRMHQQAARQAEERVALAEERAKRAAAEEANRSSAFLAEASSVLANSLDFQATLRGLARLAVPFLADLSVVRVADEQSRASGTEWAWSERGRGTVVQSLPDCQRLHPALRTALEDVLATGKLEALQLDVPAADTAPEPAADGTLQSAIIFPLAARGRTLGALILGLGSSGRHFRDSDLALAEDLAARAAIAVDNALLVRGIQDADRRKDEFLAMLAHELRNPMAPIRNTVQVMRLMAPANPQLQWAHEVIERQILHLNRLVDDLLDVSRITRGKIRLQMEPLDVTAAVNVAVETSRPLIESRKHELILSLPSQPLRVDADPTRLAQVLANLLNNAAKYTQEGGRVWLSVEREGDEAVFRVRDNGSGIPPEMLPRIFDLFTQVDQSLDRSQGGLGIGLTLVRRLVEMHHGTVKASSAGPGQGSEFVVRLPALAPGTTGFKPTNGGLAPSAPHAKYRVLVVDDNVDAADSLAVLVRLHGHEVRIANDGHTALETAQDFRPEVVLLDIGLPGMNGYEVARRLRAGADGNRLLLAAVTGYGHAEDRSRSRQAGIDHHLVKPIDPEALRQLLCRRPA